MVSPTTTDIKKRNLISNLKDDLSSVFTDDFIAFSPDLIIDGLNEVFEKTSTKIKVLCILYIYPQTSTFFTLKNKENFKEFFSSCYFSNIQSKFIEDEIIEKTEDKLFQLTAEGNQYLLNYFSNELKNCEIVREFQRRQKIKSTSDKNQKKLLEFLHYEDIAKSITHQLRQQKEIITLDIDSYMANHKNITDSYFFNANTEENIEIITNTINELFTTEYDPKIKGIRLNCVSKNQSTIIYTIPDINQNLINVENQLIQLNIVVSKTQKTLKKTILETTYICDNVSCTDKTFTFKNDNPLRLKSSNKKCPICKKPYAILNEKKGQYLEFSASQLNNIFNPIEEEQKNKLELNVRAFGRVGADLQYLARSGNELKLIGYLKSIPKLHNRKYETMEEDIFFICLGFEPADIFQLSKDEIKDIENKLDKLEKDNINILDWLKKPLNDIFPYEYSFILTLIIIQQILTHGRWKNINILIVGYTGMWKSSTIESAENILILNPYKIDIEKMTAPAFLGSKGEDNISISKALQHRGGTIIFDEINQDQDPSKYAIMCNEIMEKQKSKRFNVRADVDHSNLDIRFIFLYQKSIKELDEPIYDYKAFFSKKMDVSTVNRIPIIIDLDNLITKPKITELRDKNIMEDKPFILTEIDSLRLKMINYIRQREDPKIPKTIKKKLQILKAEQIKLKSRQEVSSRLMRDEDLIYALVVTIAKLRMRDIVTNSDLIEASALLLQIERSQNQTTSNGAEKVETIDFPDADLN